MTKDEVREHIVDILRDVAEQGYERKRGYDSVGSFADQILALFEGWKSPEEMTTMLDDTIYFYTGGIINKVRDKEDV
jgi:hypothetical protein